MMVDPLKEWAAIYLVYGMIKGTVAVSSPISLLQVGQKFPPLESLIQVKQAAFNKTCF